jgi:hypothetical protein
MLGPILHALSCAHTNERIFNVEESRLQFTVCFSKGTCLHEVCMQGGPHRRPERPLTLSDVIYKLEQKVQRSASRSRSKAMHIAPPEDAVVPAITVAPRTRQSDHDMHSTHAQRRALTRPGPLIGKESLDLWGEVAVASNSREETDAAIHNHGHQGDVVCMLISPGCPFNAIEIHVLQC